MIHIIEDNSHPSFSPSFRSPHSMNTGKRARSPEGSDGHGDRPSKRLSLAIADVSRHTVYRHLSVSSASSSRHTSEDWVQQARGLTIDSPLYPPSDHGRPFTPLDESGGEDVDMAMDSEENTMHENENLEMPHLASINTESSPFTHFHPPNEQLHLHQQLMHPQQPQPERPNPQHTYGTHNAEKMQALVPAIPPLINVVPATPVHAHDHQHQHHPQHIVNGAGHSHSDLMYSAPQPSTPPSSSPVPMAISPTNSFTQLAPASPMTARKRVVFGPRSNCEKCRSGESHFIHYE